jgi:hypothetical protein
MMEYEGILVSQFLDGFVQWRAATVTRIAAGAQQHLAATILRSL